jgi:hypothetical protein
MVTDNAGAEDYGAQSQATMSGRSQPLDDDRPRRNGPQAQTPGDYAMVEFKRQKVRKYECPATITPGQYVIVDGDRGQDCGLVVCTMRCENDGTVKLQCMDGSAVDVTKIKLENGRVLRPADPTEIHTLHNEMATLERQALQLCRSRSAELGLPIEVVDCEFQFDRKKVSFYFESNDAVDFRLLVRDLYKVFGARIWMENINCKVKNTVPAGALSHQQKAAIRRGGPGSNGPARGGSAPFNFSQ